MSEAGGLFAVPYQYHREGESPERMAERNGRILEILCDHPHWYAAPMEREQIRQSAAWLLTHPEHLKWEVNLGGRQVGMLHLSRLLPGVDALLHFAFNGVSLLSARSLIWNFIGKVCFGQLDLQRVSFEVPEHIPTLAKFMRSKLRFLYENELSLERVPLGEYLVEHLRTKKAGRFHMDDPHASLARLGARREQAHWDGTQYRDVLLLRLLRAEYDAVVSAQRGDSRADEPIRESTVESVPEASRVSASDSSGLTVPPE